MGRSGASGPA
ncbi:siderophore-interacting protein, partial [Bordetella holmesii H620]